MTINKKRTIFLIENPFNIQTAISNRAQFMRAGSK
jgi:hypothetical protein